MKRKIKVFISAALCLMMVLGNVAIGGEGFAQALDTFSIKANAAENVLSYYITDGSVTICDCDESAKGEIIIPSTYKGYPVTCIGGSAFFYCTGITSVTIPDSVTEIESVAFAFCDSLSTVNIGNEITSIGESAFSGCTALTSITIPDSVTNIGIRAFFNCTGLTSITIPDNITSISNETFSGCTGLTSVNIPNGVTSIGDYAFEKCNNLTSVTIPDSVTSIGHGAFSGCTGLTSVTIPDSVTSIGDYAFSEVNNISYSENMKADGSPWGWGAECVNGFVDGYLVYYDSSKTGLCSCSTKVTGSIDIPADVEYINYEAFIGCTGITRINVDRDNLDYSNDQHGVLFDKEKEYIIRYPAGNLRTRYSIPDDVEYIYPYAFEQCNNLKSITIPNGVTRIESYTFYGCTGLKNINIPDSVTNIGSYAFYGCSDLAGITIPNSVTIIQYATFYGCTGLKNINIPGSVTDIDYYAFYGCSGLASITIPNSVTSIGGLAFSDCTALTNITIPNSVTSIEYAAFCDCTGLTSITIPDGVENIEQYAFAYCDNLKFVHIPESVTSIGSEILYSTPAYICSDTDNCTAKEYADENGIEFRVCDGCHISITNHKEISVDYKSKLIFHANVKKLPEGASIMWVVENNNGPVKYSPSKELVIDYATENYKIKAQVVYLNENFIAQSEVLSESEVENINVNTSFFAKLISFFRGLFGNLPVWIDNVEQ